MSLFVHEAKLKPSDLTAIYIDSVSEENTLSVLEKIISYRGDIFKLPSDNDPAVDVLLTAEQLQVRKDEEQIDFDNILATKLGRISQTMLRNTPVGKQIVSLYVGVGRNAEDPSLDLFLG
jgi:hypothetical protein